ncbi:MAG: NlpC/P60 family protein [Lachnospiraceae bacterium]|nr:NlpC/P60 family protein [Lachnospiraceae bacterium]
MDMTRKRKKGWMLALIVLCVMMLAPMTASAAKLKKVNVDKYIGLGKKYTVFAYNPNRKWIKVRTRKSTKANYYSQMINYGGALVVNTSKLKKGTKVSWIPVYMHSVKTKSGYKTGYILSSQVKLKALYTKKFSDNRVIDRAIKIGFKYLGTPFVMPGASLTSGIDCAQFVAAVYRAAGRGGLGTHTDFLQAACREVFYNRSNRTLSKSQLNRMRPGDLLFYLKYDTSGPIDHVGIYIGGGLMINSSGHYGERYPNGGVCIKRVQYGNRKIVRCMRLRGY